MTAPSKHRPRDGWLLVALAAWSGHYFFRYGGTAYEWPAVDIAPLVARKLDPTFLAEDYFTNASAEPNPRHVFGALMATLARVLGDDWYAALFMLRVAAAFFLPVAWYLVLGGYARLRLAGEEEGLRFEDGGWKEAHRRPPVHPSSSIVDPPSARARISPPTTTADFAAWLAATLVIVAGLAEIVRPSIAALFSIAWWSPFQPQATSATYSLLFGLAGCTTLLGRTRFRTGIGLVAWAAASLLHPAVSLFVIVFHGIATTGRWRFGSAAATVVVGWVAPCAALAIVCRPTVSLSAEEFIRAYVLLRHPNHYWPPAFGSLSQWPWQHSFLLVVGLMAAVLPYAVWRRWHGQRRGDLPLVRLTVLFIAAYVGCVALQYAAVVVWPTKLLAMLGPVRFSSLGYFAWLLLAAIVAGDLARIVVEHRNVAGPRMGDRGWRVEGAEPGAFLPSSILHSPSFLRHPAWRRLLLPRGSTLALIALAAAYVGVSARDDSFERARQASPQFYAWIARTEPDSVFAVADDYVSVDLALVAHRAVFAGFGFPFREDFFAEYAYRDALLFGPVERRIAIARVGRSTEAAKLGHFRNLGPHDFVRIADQRRLDYVIIEAEHAAQFRSVAPEFATREWRVYSIAALRRAAQRR